MSTERSNPHSRAADSLRSQRRRAGISQRELAAAAGCSLSALKLFEAGYAPERSPTRERVERVLQELER